jgi:hypothetical protein
MKGNQMKLKRKLALLRSIVEGKNDNHSVTYRFDTEEPGLIKEYKEKTILLVTFDLF